MSYTKTTWTSGSTPLSADNLNNIETGIADLHDKSILINEKVFWNGCKIILYHTGNIVTARFLGTESATQAQGQKNSYITIPVGYRPATALSWTVTDQNGRRMILQADADGNIGMYYLLDPITSPTNLIWSATWAAYN